MISSNSRIERIFNVISEEASSIPWRRSKGKRVAKRLMDLAVAAPAAVVALPVMGAVALAVRATSPGPVLFKQERIGLDGKLFTLWKFRTMRAENADGSAKGIREVTRSDARLSPIGAVLRDWRLDELPQLFQVLFGQMSLVGPRPDIAVNLPAYSDEHLIRFAMPPGCTALTFTRGAFDNDWATRQAINAEYVREWHLWMDVQVIVGTFWVLLAQRATSPSVAEVPTESKRA
jgi:lipopolysaccharide/colanic/teichoic acid biosynthesis glycosyltransferase